MENSVKDYATDTGAAPADAAEKRIVAPGEVGRLAHWSQQDGWRDQKGDAL